MYLPFHLVVSKSLTPLVSRLKKTLVLSQLAAKFLVDPEDEESMKKELREAFRIYDKAGKER